VASLVPEDFRALLRGPLRWFYGATLVTSIGIGLSLLLNVIYVHDVRHHSIVFATSLLAANALISLAASPVIGTLTDLRGPAVVYLTMLVCEVIGLVVWALASSTVLLIVASVLMALASGSLFGPGSVILTRLVPTRTRQRAFGTNFMLLNLGIGFGGLVSASVVRLSHPATFTWVWVPRSSSRWPVSRFSMFANSAGPRLWTRLPTN
jgi:MFS family permease